MSSAEQQIQQRIQKGYDAGFVTDVESDVVAPGLSEDTIRFISAKKDEPEWLLAYRLKAYRAWLEMERPMWAHVDYPEIDFQAISYYAAPRPKKKLASLDEVDPEVLKAYARLGIPLQEQMMLAGVEGAGEPGSMRPGQPVTSTQVGVSPSAALPQVAVDAVFDSVSVVTTFKTQLKAVGVLFMSFSEAVKEHPELVQQYLGSVVPHTDNFYAALNAAVFTDGSFVFVPKGVRCPMELSTYFRINAKGTGQFERTLIVCEDGAYVSYLEGCTAPMRDENQLHAAVVELIAMDGAEINTRRCRTGTRATRKAAAASTTS